MTTPNGPDGPDGPDGPGAEEVVSALDYAFVSRIPDDYVPLPDTPSPDEWGDAVRRLLPGAPEEVLAEVSQHLPRLHPLISRDGVVKSALCAGLEDGALSLGFLSVAVLATRHDSALVTAESIYQAKKEEYFGQATEKPADIDQPEAKGLQGPQDTLLASRLPCGPGVTSISLRSVTFPRAEADDTRTGPPPAIGVGFLQLAVPAPRDYSVYVSIATPTLRFLDTYSGHLAYVARHLSFDAAEREQAAKRQGTVPARAEVRSP
ncbi:hypothetical protein [Streptomyces johnsoniae]|uniref:ESX secretion-associated protein EspG n=1 Tax=Streptomyces johnsoniae TaxID=3075532 RepID=A0ABU2SCS0_9ACTN|nr:hypothetical protein [Streptomyces sp. DSM 41886]MDT0445634.1 hypothetical protein [Streptomyces sp. DSM 41886]